jgi:hypothetical protein
MDKFSRFGREFGNPFKFNKGAPTFVAFSNSREFFMKYKYEIPLIDSFFRFGNSLGNPSNDLNSWEIMSKMERCGKFCGIPLRESMELGA